MQKEKLSITPQKRGRDLTVQSTAAIPEKDSPLRISPNRDVNLKNDRPKGDKRNQDHDIKTEDSQASIDHHEQTGDEDFDRLRQTLAESASKWELCLVSDNLRVEKRRDAGSNEVFFRCQATLSGIKKEAAFQAFSDLKTRRKWDSVLQNLVVVSEDKENLRALVYYQVKTLPFMSTRDALVQIKAVRGFPHDNAFALIHKSVEHPEHPEQPTHFIRIDQKCFGLVFEDSSDGGCKLSWVVRNDLKGIVPRYILNHRAIKNPQLMVDALTAVCKKIMTNTLF